MTKLIPLRGKYGRGKFTTVDDKDYECLSSQKWFLRKSHNNFYVSRSTNGRLTDMHRMIVNPPKRMTVDHANGNTLDNRRENLRIASQSQNNSNKNAPNVPKTSKYKGVFWSKDNHHWKAMATLDGKTYGAGSYTDEVHAAMAYNALALRIHGEFAKLNGIPSEYVGTNPESTRLLHGKRRNNKNP